MPLTILWIFPPVFATERKKEKVLLCVTDRQTDRQTAREKKRVCV